MMQATGVDTFRIARFHKMDQLGSRNNIYRIFSNIKNESFLTLHDRGLTGANKSSGDSQINIIKVDADHECDNRDHI